MREMRGCGSSQVSVSWEIGVRVVIAGFYGSETKREKLGYLFEMKGKRLLSLFIFDREERTIALRKGGDINFSIK
jgi:hypothetical protein